MSIVIGVIAEETNDVDVLKELTRKVIEDRAFKFKKFVGHGCGRLRNKCRAWCNNLLRAGCTHIVLVHDLDRENERQLRTDLRKKLDGIADGKKLILIPVIEMEAWLLADPEALKNVFGMTTLPSISQKPESIADAKKYLRDIVWKCCKKRYLNTLHNEKIARELALDTLDKCPSFAPYPPFLLEALEQQRPEA